MQGLLKKEKTVSEQNPIPVKNDKRKKWVITAVAVAAILLCVVGLPKLFGIGKDIPLLDLNDTTVLAYTDMVDSISADGTIESAESTMVYSTNAYTVKGVHVEVGDYVEAGQLLAELDDQNIQDQITSQKLNIASSKRNSDEQIKSAQANYDNYKYGLEHGLNSTLNSAQSKVDSALEAYEKAQLTYNRYLESLNLGENTTVLNAESALRTAQDNLDSALDALETAEDSCNDARIDYAQANEDLRLAYNDLYTLQNSQGILINEINRLKATLTSYESIKAGLESRKTAAQGLFDSLNAKKNELEAIAAADRTDAQISELNGISAQITAAEAEISRIEQELSELSDSATIQSQIAALEKELSDAQQELTALDARVKQLQTALEQAEKVLKSADKQVENAHKKIENAQTNYESQLSAYNASMTGVDNTLADYADNVESTYNAYKDALTSLEATKKSTQDQLQSYANSLSSTKSSANTDSAEENLRQLRVDLAGTRITAPCAGTITAVYAEVGASGSGLLFVIEDVDNLVVSTSVKGYDMGTVQPGMKVAIHSDATGDKEIKGVISRIAPTSNKTSFGTTDTSSEATFAAEVEITDEDTGLCIGMEAQLDYIIAQQDNVLAVPYDAVYKNKNGHSCVLTATQQEDGRYLIQEIEVETGMDDDLDMVISGANVKEGLRVINEADSYLNLLGHTVTAGTGLNTWGMPGFPGGVR